MLQLSWRGHSRTDSGIYMMVSTTPAPQLPSGTPSSKHLLFHTVCNDNLFTSPCCGAIVPVSWWEHLLIRHITARVNPIKSGIDQIRNGATSVEQQLLSKVLIGTFHSPPHLALPLQSGAKQPHPIGKLSMIYWTVATSHITPTPILLVVEPIQKVTFSNRSFYSLVVDALHSLDLSVSIYRLHN